MGVGHSGFAPDDRPKPRFWEGRFGAVSVICGFGFVRRFRNGPEGGSRSGSTQRSEAGSGGRLLSGFPGFRNGFSEGRPLTRGLDRTRLRSEEAPVSERGRSGLRVFEPPGG